MTATGTSDTRKVLVDEVRAVGRETARLLAQTARIAVGASDVGPHDKDPRFADPAWSSNPA